MNSLLEKFIASRPDGCSERTIKFYRYCLSGFIGYPLSPEGVNYYLKSLTFGNGKARRHQALKTLFLWLYRCEYIQDKVIDKVPVPKTQKRILPALSKEQLETLSQYCRCERDKALITLLLHSGMRITEAVNIKASDFNWEEGTVIVLGKGNRYRKCLAGNSVVKK
ncbi:MAG: tyrosine-type recombinase/integrase [Dehalococcoidia bacterium]|nr:MAG: tyrosine-type recombinase/integrase [Dehalococcoidia bacterium]